jgi:hypothetical protein
MTDTRPRPPADRADDLLTRLDPLPYARRRRLAREEGQRLAASGELGAVLAELWSRGHYEREVALALAIAGRDAAFVAGVLRCSEPLPARWAIRVSSHVAVPDDALAAALDDAPQALRVELYRAVRRGRRAALADRLVAEVAAVYGPGEAALLVPACSPGVIAEWLPRLPPAPALLRAAARRAPEAVLAAAADELSSLTPSLRGQWWARHSSAVGTAAETHPLRVLDLVERHGPRDHLPWGIVDRLYALLAADARRTVDILIRLGTRGPSLSPKLAHRLVAAAPTNLPVLGRALRDDPFRFAVLLRATPPSRRDAFFDAAHADIDLTHRTLPEDVLELLPRERRVAEARRMLALAERRGDAEAKRAMTAYLPYDEARGTLLEETRRPDPQARADGYRALIACAARTRDPERFAAALRSDLVRLRNEQDPVRLAVFDALDDVPAPLFGASALDVLAALARDAFDAADLSFAGRDLLGRLAARVFARHAVDGEPALADWGLATMARNFEAEHFWLPREVLYGHETRVLDALWPAVRAAADRRDYRGAFALARQLGKAGWDHTPLQEVLGEAVRHGDANSVYAGTELWLADRRQRDDRVAAVIAADPSTITLESVCGVLAERRTDLIDPFLTGEAPRGRFMPDTATWAPRIGYASARWVRRQREAYADLVVRLLIADPRLSPYERAWVAPGEYI